MKKLWVILSILILVTLVPATAFAQTPTYYCSYAVTTGNGSYATPWPCANQTQLSDAIANVCAATNYGILYQIVSTGFYRHVIETSGETCVVTNTTFYYGYPPNTGIALPAPVLISGAVVLGALLIAGGFLFYRKRYA